MLKPPTTFFLLAGELCQGTEHVGVRGVCAVRGSEVTESSGPCYGLICRGLCRQGELESQLFHNSIRHSFLSARREHSSWSQ